MKLLSSLIVVLLVLSSCSSPVAKSFSKNISGAAQKGPFANGTSVSIYELRDNLSQTGLSFNSQIQDDSGSFSLGSTEFSSNFVKLRADGYYFNEVTGSISNSQLTLYSLSDISQRESININLISHLEKDRIEYLIRSGQNFPDAKKQALKEIVRIFSIDKEDLADSGSLDILHGGDDNAILLAISVILQGFRSTSELSELLSAISTDIKEDGVLDSGSLGSKLINDVKIMDLAKIRANLEKRIIDTGFSGQIPEFEKYVQMFMSNTSFVFTKKIDYPSTVNGKVNLLHDSVTSLTKASSNAYQYTSNGSLLCLATTDIPDGMSLKIVVKGRTAYEMFVGYGWNFHSAVSDPLSYSNQLDALQKKCYQPIIVEENAQRKIVIEFYTADSNTPFRTKTIELL